MSILERVATLIKANLNELIERAEEPEKMIKQVILDLETSRQQLKQQVAVVLADQHLLEKKYQQSIDEMADWMRRAETSVDKKEDGLARSALERYVICQKAAKDYERQLGEQKGQVDSLKTALDRLEHKLLETRSKEVLLLAQYRRSRAMGRAGEVQMAVVGQVDDSAFRRMQEKVMHAEAVGHAMAGMAVESLDEQFDRLEEQDMVEDLLAEIKNRRKPD